MAITQIDRPTAKLIRDRLELLLQGMNMPGIVATIDSGRYSSTSVIFKVECAVVDASGVRNKTVEDWKLYACTLGLPEDALGKKVRLNGEECEIVGIKPRSWRFPVLAKKLSSGRVFKFPAETVKFALTMAAANAAKDSD